MPATEKTFYRLERLHLWMGAASVALFVVTVWMLIADHRREWKRYQRVFRDRVEPWTTAARIKEQKTREFRAEEKRLAARLDDARRAVPKKELVERFRTEVARQAAQRGDEVPDFSALDEAYHRLADKPTVAARQALLAQLREFLAAAALRQSNVERRLRFRRSELDEARSYYEAGVGEGLPAAEIKHLRQETARLAQKVKQQNTRLEEAEAHRRALQGILDEITRQEDLARDALARHRSQVDRLQRSLDRQTPGLAERLLRLPLIEALGRPLAIEQIWLPELRIDYNFREVARFDRCVTCHQGIQRTAPGLPAEPAFPGRRVLRLQLATPEQPPQQPGEDQLGREPLRLEPIYGLSLAPRGMLRPDAATIDQVMPRSAAAWAGLRVGDVILKVNDARVRRRGDVLRLLLHEVDWGRPLKLEVRRGLPHPYASHPRPGLFVGSLSPHPMADFGCTICHQGQGSATEFRWASHTPNAPSQEARWREQYGWFRNPHWDFPMLAARFAESRCLRCHHQVTDLLASPRFPDPPAAKLLAGYHLIRRHGCFGCHEIRGYDESGRPIGPDMRLEPNYAEAALQLLAEGGLSDRQRRLVGEVIDHPEDPAPRQQLLVSLKQQAEQGGQQRQPHARAAVELLATEEPRPGTMRKVGPSLRDVRGRLDPKYLADWLGDPTRFLPTARMPQFYGMHECLQGRALADARRFEAVEIRATVEYLLSASQPVEPLSLPVGDPRRGKRLFETHGCLACHRLEDEGLPEGQSTQGPDLSRVGAKYAAVGGAAWLASWIRDPLRQAPRTLMPGGLFDPLVPAATPGAENDGSSDVPTGQGGAGQPTDPAADIAAYLLSRRGWQPAEPPPFAPADLDELTLLHLNKTFPAKLAETYLREGIPESLSEPVQGDAAELSGPISRQKKLRYVGRRTIRKRGCYGCHDIPGFEDAQRIGPALTDWGRKRESLLAFEQVDRFVAQTEPPGDGQGRGRAADRRDPRRAFFLEALREHRRVGFIWQKLRAPRSFDFLKAESKDYNEHLTMGRFCFTDEQREAVITFVLGLVAQPPAEKYVYRPDPRRKAIVEGHQVLDKYACAECHTLEMERWAFEYDPAEFADPPTLEDWEFLRPRFSPQQLATSAHTDRRGLGRAEVVGMPQVDLQGELLIIDEDEDQQGNTAYLYAFTPWEPAAVHGQVWRVGGADLLLWGPDLRGDRVPPGGLDVSYFGSRITAVRPPRGGALARLLFPTAVAEAEAAGANVMGPEVWGWLPPPLVREGAKVRPAWLHDYLLEPFPIRPASLLRMPRYNMSAAEAGALVAYFAAVSGASFPYSSNARTRDSYLEQMERRRPGRLQHAMRMVLVGGTDCAKCHLIGDHSPGGDTSTTLAPNLERVGRRIRPGYLRRWLANPRSVLPYTAMTANFPPSGAPLEPDLFDGNTLEQLDAVMDLLLNYDWYLKRRVSTGRLVESGDTDGDTTLPDRP